MAQCLAPSVQWQMRLTKNAMETSSMTSKLWNSLSMRQSKKGAIKTATKFKICASAKGTINRMEDLLNLDVTPYTNKIIAEYIWYILFRSLSIGKEILNSHVLTFTSMFFVFLNRIGGSGTDVRSKSKVCWFLMLRLFFFIVIYSFVRRKRIIFFLIILFLDTLETG